MSIESFHQQVSGETSNSRMTALGVLRNAEAVIEHLKSPNAAFYMWFIWPAAQSQA